MGVPDGGSSGVEGGIPDGAMAIDGGPIIPCGPVPLEIVTTPPRTTIGLLEFTYDADSNLTGVETWSLRSAPSGMTVDGMGVVRWMPVRGMHDVALQVADACGRSIVQLFSLTVISGAVNGMNPEVVTRSTLAARPEAMRVLASGALRRSVTAPAVRAALDDSRSVALLRSIVRCALPRGESVEAPTPLGPQRLPGQMGLASHWGRGPCDLACREWVSACTLALMNPAGEQVTVSLGGSHPALEPGAWGLGHEEGAFFGNLFVDPPIRRACRGSAPTSRLGSRTCTRGDARCPITVVGPCGDLDAAVGRCANSPEQRPGWSAGSRFFSRSITARVPDRPAGD